MTTVATTGYTAAQLFDVGLAIARAWTVDGSGGQAFAFTGSQNLLRTSMQAPAAVSARLMSGAALTPGTLTTDTNDLAVLQNWAVAAAAGYLSHSAADLQLRRQRRLSDCAGTERGRHPAS